MLLSLTAPTPLWLAGEANINSHRGAMMQRTPVFLGPPLRKPTSSPTCIISPPPTTTTHAHTTTGIKVFYDQRVLASARCRSGGRGWRICASAVPRQ